MGAEEATGREAVGVDSTQASPRDSFSDVDSQLGEWVRGLADPPPGVGPGTTLGPGTVIGGHFEIIRKLGQGGMGVVFAARDRRLDREVAIKLVGRRSEQATLRLEREAQAMAQLAHPNVVTVHEVGQHEGAVYIAMEYVDGPTLRGWQGAARRSWRELVAVYVQAARGLAAAHATGFVHRDFKPDNVLLGRDGRARVADFGLARTHGSLEESRGVVVTGRSAATPALTASDAVLGTPAYMAPEQFDSSVPIGPRVDQFAFGVALHEALTGLRPFGEVPNWVANAADRVHPPAARELPRWLRRVIDRTLAFDPAARYPDMHALGDALERGLGQARARRRWALATVGVGAAVAIGMGLGTASRPSPCTDAAADAARMWSAERRAALAGAFAADGASAAQLWRGLDPLVDAWIARWSAARHAGCTATRIDGSQSEQLLDRQLACLDVRLGRVTAVLDALQRDRGPRQRADHLLADLPEITPCGDPQYLLARVAPPEDPAVRERVAGLRDALHRAEIELEFGESTGIRARVAELLAQAEALGHAPLVAEARWYLGRVALAEGHRDEAAALLREAYFTARGAGDDERAASIAASLGYLDGALRNDAAAAELWLQHAEADVRRGAAPPGMAIVVETTRTQNLLAAGAANDAVAAIGRAIALAGGLEATPLQQIILHAERAAALDAAGRHTEALTQYDATLAQATAVLGPGAQRVGMLHNNRGLARYYARDFAGAIADLRRALAIEAELGTPPTSSAAVRMNLGLALAADGALDDAAAMLEAVHALWRAQPGAVAELALVSKALAWVELRRHRTDRAHALAREALALAREALEPEHPEIATSATLLGDVVLAQGDADAAIAQLEAAAAIWRAPNNAGHPSSADTMAALGEAYLAAGRRDDARGQADAVLQLAARIEVGEDARARAHFLRARIRGDGGDEAGARDEARAAVALYAGSLYATERGEVERWLAARGGSG